MHLSILLHYIMTPLPNSVEVTTKMIGMENTKASRHKDIFFCFEVSKKENGRPQTTAKLPQRTKSNYFTLASLSFFYL